MGTTACRKIQERCNTVSLRASFWERAVAIAADLLLINLIIAVIGLALTGATGGQARKPSAAARRRPGSCASRLSYHCFVTDTRNDRGSSGWKWMSLAAGPAG